MPQLTRLPASGKTALISSPAQNPAVRGGSASGLVGNQRNRNEWLSIAAFLQGPAFAAAVARRGGPLAGGACECKPHPVGNTGITCSAGACQ